MRRFWRKRSAGQALVEFAFIFPVIALLAFGFIDIGRAVFTENTLANAAREGSRVAAVNQLDPVNGPWLCQSNKPIEDPSNPGWTFRGCVMTSGAALGIQHGDISISYAAPPGTTITCTGGTLTVGCIVTVTVVTNYVPITPVAGSVIGPISMTATSSMPIERLFP
ncbi:MAG: pilus assembly protein [Chloroflexi bacterium]|nr:pilus assembly protein [Chloroflexota bacterium]